MKSRKPDEDSSFYIEDSNDSKPSFGNSAVESFGNYEEPHSNIEGEKGDDEGIYESGSVLASEAGTLTAKPGQETIKIHIDNSVLCPLSGAAAFVQGGIVGSVVGLFSGISQTLAEGAPIERSSIPRALGSSILRSGWGFGLYMGTYSATKCFMKTSRGKTDLLNTFAAGFAAGYVGTLHTRSHRAMTLSGMASGVLMTVLDSLHAGPL